MRNFLILLTFFYLTETILCARDSRSPSAGHSEYAIGGGYFTLSKPDSDYVNPGDGFLIRLQNGNGQASIFSLVNNLEFAMSGNGLGDFKDDNGAEVTGTKYDLYLINYSLGFRISPTPNSPVLPYMGAGGVVSVATFQFKNNTSDVFPERQRGFMFGYDLFLGLDLFLSGNKDKGWGLRVEGDLMTLYPLGKFIMGKPHINSANLVLLFVTTF